MNRFLRSQTIPPIVRAGHWFLLFSLIGFGLRLQKLRFQPLWGDEGWSFYFAMQPWSSLLALTAADIHPPFYYLLLKTWLFITGPGPAQARFFSVIVGTALIPVVGILGRRLFDWRIGGAAAAVVSVMPLAVYYSQEVRMYGLVTLLGVLSVYFFARVEAAKPAADQRKWRIAYIAATTAALYTMYYAVFIPFFQFLYILLTGLFPRRSRRQGSGQDPPTFTRPQRKVPGRTRILVSKLRVFLYVGLLYLPWIIYVGPRLPDYVQNKRVLDDDQPLNLIHFLGDHLVAFSLGHLPSELDPYVWTVLPFIILAGLGIVGVLYFSQSNHLHRAVYLYLYLFIPLLIGYGINQFFPFTPPDYERTLLLAAPAYWLFIAVGLIWLWDRQYLLVGTVVLAMLLVVAVSLTGFYNRPRHPLEDYRPLLEEIAARATPEDTLLASYQWQLGFYYAYLPPTGPQYFAVPGWGEGWAGPAGRPQRVADLKAIFEKSARLWFPAHQALGHQWEDEAEATIAALGYPARLAWYSPQTKLTLAGAPAAVFTEAPSANFEDRLMLLEAGVGRGPYEAGRGVIPIKLSWQKLSSLGSEHRLNLRLADGTGRTWASRDSQPRAGQLFFTDLAVGDTLNDRHGLLIPAGTPPGSYRLLLSVRRTSDAHPLDLLDSAGQPLGAEVLLADIEVISPEPPVGPAALPVQVETGATFGQTANLVGYSLGQEPFRAGEQVGLTLFWQALGDQSDPLTVSVRLQDAGGQIVAGHNQPPIWPAANWERGTLLRDPQDVALPPTLPPGQYRVEVSLLTPEQVPLKVNGSDRLLLTTVTTVDRPHVFEPPTPDIPLGVSFGDQARLIGLDLPHTQVKAGDHLPLTLYWQALDTFDKSWTVFVHLIDREGQIISQQDQIPGGGQFPTTGWLPDEYLVDAYNLVIPADTPPGQAYHLEIGLYDPNQPSRLPVVEAGQVVNDHLLLESWPISVE
jgi:hypothetical protein